MLIAHTDTKEVVTTDSLAGEREPKPSLLKTYPVL